MGTYSGGMKRRLSVAMCFIGDPQIVFLDRYDVIDITIYGRDDVIAITLYGR